MVDTQEIIERSIYSALLTIAVEKGYTLDPKKYLPATPANKILFNNDKANLISTGKPFVSIFGAGNNQSRGMKECPRISIDPMGFFPGDIGFPKQSIDKADTGYMVSESNYTESVDQLVNITLTSNNISHMRLLHNILNSAIPQRGYIKPYIYDEKPFEGNLFIMVSNFYSLPDTDKGIMEKVYQFTVKDTILEELFIPSGEIIPPLQDISLLNNEMSLLEIKNNL